MEKVNFDETKQSQLPFAEMLINMGYRYIPVYEVNEERGGDTSNFILRDTARRKFSEINEYEHNGQTFKFTDAQIAEVVDELENIQMEGLIDTSKKIYNMIMPKIGGKTIKVFHDGSYQSKSFKYIDFANPKNNDFAFTVEFEASGKKPVRPDIVIFVNGIPFAVVENKKSTVEVEKAIAQHLRNQNPNHCPKLFIYPQLLIAANKEELLYGTSGTPEKFYVNWKERSLQDEEWKYRDSFKSEFEEKVQKIIKTSIDDDLYEQLLKDLNGYTSNHSQITDRLPTKQDLSVYAMLRPERLLDIAKNYVLYDAGTKKVMRYQQFFAIKKMLKRIEKIKESKTGKRREGGILWHTQGSGKSLTMVMFVKALIENPHIKNPRVVIVTDRKDLDRQIKGTFNNAGLKKDVIQAKSGKHLLRLIKEKDLRVITTLVHKFPSSKEHGKGFVDDDKDIFVLIDEGHRSQHGIANIEMNRVIPNACYIAFTGTPLLKEEKSNQKFGRFIDKYTIDDALDDDVILPLIYEGRYVDLRQDSREVDKQVERISEDLKPKEKKIFQNQIKSKVIKDNPQRITEIAFDIEKHFIKQFQGTGLKAQIVAPSKYSATLFQKFFINRGKINTAIVISDENGLIREDDEHKKEVEEYLMNIKANYQSLKSYEEEVIDSFKYNEDGVEILIVVDKLLTGFDAPRNTVLYLAKDLKDHNLLQAIARVNRLFDNDTLPKTAGYIIDYSENAENLRDAMELFGNYDEEDVKGTLINVSEKINELEQAFAQLHARFKDVAEDDEAYIQSLSDEPTRQEFYEDLNNFVSKFNECVVLQDFVHEFEDLDEYRRKLKKYMHLKKTTSVRYADTIDWHKYKQALIKILDKNIKAEEAELLTKQISINDKEVFEKALEDLGSDASKAEAIAAQMERTISEKIETDPEYYRRFSQKIKKLLDDMRESKLADIAALKEARRLQKEMEEKTDDQLPERLAKIRGGDILYRNFQPIVGEKLEDKLLTDIVIEITEIIKSKAIVDWYFNQEQIRIMTNAIDDYFYDEVKIKKGIDLSADLRKKLTEDAIELARQNHEVFS